MTLAERHCYAALEAALRDRIKLAGGSPSGTSGLKALTDLAFKLNCLKREDFEVPSPGNPTEKLSLSDIVRLLRNNLAHGKVHLLPAGSLETMRLCADILGRLYPPEATAGKNAA